MQKRFYTGIDIGTYHVKVVIAAPAETPDLPMRILGTGTAGSKGMRQGYIVDVKEAAHSIREALERASAAAHTKVESAHVGIGGVGLDEIRASGDVSLTPSGGIVTARDMEHASKEAEKRSSAKLANRTVLHAIPMQYRLDGAQIFGSPEGLHGAKLSVDVLLITMLGKHHDDLLAAVEAAGVEIEGVMASPLAASFVALTKAQKTAGVVLANIGAETLSIIIYDNDTPLSVKIFPIGGNVITEAIALTFQIPLPEAEQAKRGAVLGSELPQKKLQQLVQARFKDMFTLVGAHLKSIGRDRLLPAGIVLTGGGSGLAASSDVARMTLKLPSQISQIGSLPRSASVDSAWAVAYGLCRWGYAETIAEGEKSISDVLRGGWHSVKSAMRSLLP